MIALHRRTLLQLLALLPLVPPRLARHARPATNAETTTAAGYGSGAYGSGLYGGAPATEPAESELYIPLIVNDPK